MLRFNATLADTQRARRSRHLLRLLLIVTVVALIILLPYYKIAQAKLPCEKSVPGNWYVDSLEVGGSIGLYWVIDVAKVDQEEFLRCLSNDNYDVKSLSGTMTVGAKRDNQLITNTDWHGWDFNGRFAVLEGAPLTL